MRRDGRCRIRNRQYFVRTVARSARRHAGIAQRGDLAVERIAIGRQVIRMAVAALVDHLRLERRLLVLLDAMRAVAVVAARRGQVALVPHLAVLARRELLPLLLVAIAAGVRNARAVGGAVRIGLRADRVRAMAVGAGRRGTSRGAGQRLPVNAVVELADDVAAGQFGAAPPSHRCRGICRTSPRGSRDWCAMRDPWRAGCRAGRGSRCTPRRRCCRPCGRGHARWRCIP